MPTSDHMTDGDLGELHIPALCAILDGHKRVFVDPEHVIELIDEVRELRAELQRSRAAEPSDAAGRRVSCESCAAGKSDGCDYAIPCIVAQEFYDDGHRAGFAAGSALLAAEVRKLLREYLGTDDRIELKRAGYANEMLWEDCVVAVAKLCDPAAAKEGA